MYTADIGVARRHGPTARLLDIFPCIWSP